MSVVTLHSLFLFSDPPPTWHPPSYWLGLFSSQTFSCINTPTFSTPVILHTYPPMKMEQSVPKRRHIKFRRRGNYPEESIKNFHSFLPFALENVRRSASHPCIFIPGRGSLTFSEAGRAPEMVWKLRKRQIFCAIRGNEPRFFGSSIRSLVTMQTEPSRLLMWLWKNTLTL